MKIANIDREVFISSERLEETDVTYDIKAKKNHNFTLSLEDTFLKKEL